MTRFTIITFLLLAFFGNATFAQEPAAPAATAGAKVEVEKDYIIKAFDVLALAVFQEAELSAQSQVSTTGEVSFPLIGVVKVGGMTLHQATDKVTELYAADYLISPKVNLALNSISPEIVTIMGAVMQPKELAIPRDSTLDLVSAIASAGGPTANADKKRIMLKRDETTTTYNYEELTTGKAAQVILQKGDRIDVPVNALANKTVTIIGEVGRATVTPFPLDGKLNLQTFVGTVGGFTEMADKSRITIERNGKTFSVNLDASSGLIPLNPGDVINVPRNTLVGQVIAINGKVNKPGPVAFPLKGDFTLLSAIANAGGFSPLANPKNVTITRSVNGRNEVFNIDTNKISSGKTKDFILQPGDSISVPERLF